jgi:SAM-dependent methyltransferase
MPAWFDLAFGPWYLKLYAHRDREEAARMLHALRPWLPGTGRILDVACGAGRHLEILHDEGATACGIDRSAALLAAVSPRLHDRLLRADMRYLPFLGNSFAALLCLFTSFGYFGTDLAHRALLLEFARVAAPGGRLFLDVANPPALRATLNPSSERVVEGHTVRERRALERRGASEVVVKEITVESAAGSTVGRFREEVTLYERGPLLELLRSGGWRERAVLGDYEGGGWSAEAPRLLVIAERVGS